MKIVIPAQRFEHAKSRLQDAWSPAERADHAKWMLTRVLSAIEGAGKLSQTWVLSDDADVRAFAQERGASAQADRPNIDGHGAQLRAVADALDDTTGLLVLMSDLPLMTADALKELLTACATADVVLAPDRHTLGTNAAFFATRTHRRLHFGHTDSFVRHRRACHDDARLIIHKAPAFQYDLDSPQDLQVLQQWQRRYAPEDDALARCLWGSHA